MIWLLAALASRECMGLDAEGVIEQCFAREGLLESGHIEFRFDVNTERRSSGVPEPGEMYLEWAPERRVRIGRCDAPDKPLVVSDGESCRTATGELCPSEYLTELLPGMGSLGPGPFDESADLAQSVSIYSPIFRLCLFPISMGREYTATTSSETYAWRLISDGETIPERQPGVVVVRGLRRDLSPQEPSGAYSRQYAIHAEHSVPTTYWFQFRDDEPELVCRWFGVVTLRGGPSLPRRMAVQDTPRTGDVTKIELIPERSWIGPVDPGRFFVPEPSPLASLQAGLQDRLARPASWIHHTVFRGADPVFVGLAFVLAGALWFGLRLVRRRRFAGPADTGSGKGN